MIWSDYINTNLFYYNLYAPLDFILELVIIYFSVDELQQLAQYLKKVDCLCILYSLFETSQ